MYFTEKETKSERTSYPRMEKFMTLQPLLLEKVVQPCIYLGCRLQNVLHHGKHLYRYNSPPLQDTATRKPTAGQAVTGYLTREPVSNCRRRHGEGKPEFPEKPGQSPALLVQEEVGSTTGDITT